MYPELPVRNVSLDRGYPMRQKGIGLPAALFVIVVVGFLVVAIHQLLDVGSASVDRRVLSVRAFYAAESGGQLAVTRLFPPSGSAASCNSSLINQSFSAAGLNGCSASVECQSVAVDGRTIYTLLSTGRCQSGAEQAVRQVEIKARGD